MSRVETALHSLWDVIDGARRESTQTVRQSNARRPSPASCGVGPLRRLAVVEQVEESLQSPKVRRWGGVLLCSIVVHVLLFWCLAWFFIETKTNKSVVIDSKLATQDAAPTVAILDTFEIEKADAGQPESNVMSFLDSNLTADIEDPEVTKVSVNQAGAGQSPFRGGGNGGAGGGFGNLFGGTTGANTIVFVIDRSGSMAGYSMEEVKKELIAAIMKLKPRQKFHVVVYNDRSQMLTASADYRGYHERSNPQPINRERLVNRIQALKGFGGTNGEAAMLRAIRYQPELIVFLTDGHFNLNSNLVLKRIKGNTRIDSVIIDQDSSALRAVSRATGGSYRRVNK